MICSRCKSDRIQRDYDEAFAVMRLAGMRKFLCNDCGHVFLGFDPLGKIRRSPAKRNANLPNRRRSARFQAHLPTSICLIHDGSNEGRVAYSESSQGHCEAINEHGMGLSLVGSRFEESELTRIGRLLLVRIRLPETTVEAIVTLRNHQRVGDNKNRKWFLGVQLQRISETDKAHLITYLKNRQKLGER